LRSCFAGLLTNMIGVYIAPPTLTEGGRSSGAL